MWILNEMLLNNDCVNEEIKGEIKKYLETNENENTTCQNLWDTAKSSSKREVYSDTGLSQQTRKISNKQSKNAPKGTGKRRTNKAQNQ